MRTRLAWLFVTLLFVAVGCVIALASLTPVSTSSSVQGFAYMVNTARVNWYLLANGYNKTYQAIRIELVDTPQTGYRVTGKGGEVLQSVSAVKEQSDLVMRVQYKMGAREYDYTRDLYMYLCLAMQGGNPQPNDCYQRADMQIAREKWLPGEVVSVKQGRQVDAWSLIKQVYAQTCGGSIACGGWTSGYRCSIGGKVCSSDLDCSISTEGTCQPSGSQTCDTTLNNINCKTLTDKAQCETQGYVSNCNIKCNTSAENFCSWG